MLKMADGIVVIGAGGHAKVVIDILETGRECIAGITDAAKEKGSLCMGYAVLGTDAQLPVLYNQGIIRAALGIGHVGNPSVRNKAFKTAKAIGFTFPALVHPSAVVAESALVGEGSVCAAGSVVNPEARIGKACIINTNAVIEHETVIGDGAHIAPNAVILGAAHIGEDTFAGAGSVVLQGVTVGRNCIIGAGTVVLRDVADNTTIAGIPGRALPPRKEEGK